MRPNAIMHISSILKQISFLRSHDQCECIVTGYNAKDTDAALLCENETKDARALAIIQQAVHDSVFSKNCFRHNCSSSLDRITDAVSGRVIRR
ncbi:hypothetical protein Hanom_Chr01g00001251 [Helianthus anomalus]